MGSALLISLFAVNSSASPAWADEVLGVSLPAPVEHTWSGGSADTLVTPYVATQGGNITSWKAEFQAGDYITGCGLPVGIQLKVLRAIPATTQVQVIAAGTVHDPRPTLEARYWAFGGTCRGFRTDDIRSVIEFTDFGLTVSPGDIIGLTIKSDPNVGGYYYPLVSGSGTPHVSRDVMVGDSIDLSDRNTLTLTNWAPALQIIVAGNTPVGTNIAVQPVDTTTGTTPVTLTCSNVTQAGTTSLTTSGTGTPPPSGFKLGDPPTYYELTTTAMCSGTWTVCINYSGVSYGTLSSLQIFHLEGGNWVPLPTLSLDTTSTTICASASSLSAFAVFEPEIRVAIDIKPGSFPNAINPKAKGTIPVAILSTPSFDAPTRVDKTSLTFGRKGDEPSFASCNRGGRDVNGDGRLDLVCHFRTPPTAFQRGDTVGVLKGKTKDPLAIKGSDSVRIVP